MVVFLRRTLPCLAAALAVGHLPTATEGYTTLLSKDDAFIKHCMFEYVEAEARKAERTPALVQVGAHLAWLNPNDPFAQRFASNAHFRTVLVEPQPLIYQRLAKAAEGVDSVSVLNRAVCNQTGEVTFYAVDMGERAVEDTKGVNMASQVASLSKEHILKHKKWVPDIDQHIIEIQVKCEVR